MKKLIEHYLLTLRAKYLTFLDGYKNFLLGVVSWIIHIYDEEVYPDFWVTIDSDLGWITYQEFKVFTIGYNIRTGQKIKTYPSKKFSY